MSLENSASIGIFDSGVGGLSVMKEIQVLLPHENLIYLADSGNVPYGDKTPQFIVNRCLKISEFLISQGCKCIVIACNTASAGGIKAVRMKWTDVPVIGMEPAVKPAVAATKTGVVGVLATVGTLKSAQFAGLLEKFAGASKVITQPAPGLVECVEEGDLESEKTLALVESFVNPLLEKNADVIVLGCTHYPFLKKIIAKIAGSSVSIIDTGGAVARQVQRRLQMMQIETQSKQNGNLKFFTSGDLKKTERALNLLWSPGTEVAFFREE
jgi:glutamate racemase